MKGYNYYIRSSTGDVDDENRQENTYNLVFDNNVKTLRPPRNFWRLNLLPLNKQPETCDFETPLSNLNCGNDQIC